jgi:MoaA/NifB/PqqE/SkfB family radical SAM enzyme
MLAKYLGICGIAVNGFVSHDTLDEYSSTDGMAVILDSDKSYNDVYQNIARENLIFLTEKVIQRIAYKVSPRKPEEYFFEVNIADHCNLNCKMCDHFSPLVKKPHFLDIAEFERDIKRLSLLSGGRLGAISLVGGEPLLNPGIVDYLKIGRQHFNDTPIWVWTNGLLLLSPRMDKFWAACNKIHCSIKLTRYPIKLDIEAIRQKATKCDVDLEIFPKTEDLNYIREKNMIKYKLNKNSLQWQNGFVDCYQMNVCNVLKDGKIFICPMSAHIDYFNNYFDEHFEVSEDDFIDIHKLNSFEEIASFSSRPVPFCKYCDIKGRELYPWGQSCKSTDEYI